MQLILTKTCHAEASELCNMRKAVRQACSKLSVVNEDIDCMALAIDEACTNVIRYAYKGGKNGPIELQVFLDDDDIVFHLIDYADSVDPKCIEPHKIELLQPGGLGIHLMHKVMDSVKFIPPEDNAGNVLELRKARRINPEKDEVNDV